MDLNILVFLTGLAITLFLLSMLFRGWLRLGLGWIAGGIIILLGSNIGNGGDLTSSILVDGTDIIKVTLDVGISNENFMIIFLLLGFLIIGGATLLE